jgi:hypothetical protein
MFGTCPILLAFLLVAVAPTPVVSRDDPNLEYWLTLGDELLGSNFQYARRLVSSPQDDLAEGTNVEKKPDNILPNFTIPCFNITLPVINKMIFDLVEPCGTVQMPADGITFKTAFGPYHVAGMDDINKRLDIIDHTFNKHATLLVGGIFILYVIYNAMKSSKRQAIIEQFKKMKAGHLSIQDIDPMASAAEKEQDEKDKLAIDSPKFICPGNIYRLLTVLTPREVGYGQWGSYCFKAGICAYMQLYLPINIMRHCFKQWHFNGVKSPMYWVMSGGNFFLQFAALASVCTLFAAKTANVIEIDSMACYHLLSHDPEADHSEDAASKPSAADSKVAPLLEAGNAPSAASLEKEVITKLEAKIVPPQWLLNWNEFVWCLVNMFVTCISSVMLMLGMYMKVATFTGDTMNIAIVTVSLYFVFDLDDKIMDSDPNLRPRYRRMVLKQTVKTTNDPRYLKVMASFTVGLIKATIPLGLLMITVVSWRQVLNADGSPVAPGQKPIIIGSDPFHQ